MLPSRRALTLCLAFAASCCAAATSLRAESNRKPLAFASSFSPMLFRSTAVTSAQSPFFGEISRASVSVEEVAEGATGITMMGSRRNLKKEKRLRNEHCARQYRKPKARFSRGGNRQARAEADNKDSEWLEQIYGQHTIYRRDVPGAVSGAAASEDKAPAAKQETAGVTA